MRALRTVKDLEEFGRTRLSPSFFMRDFLFSEIAAVNGMSNLPGDLDLAIETGTRLCTDLLEPLNATFGRIAIRSAYRSEEVNGFGNANGKLGCASNAKNFAAHIWDRRDGDGLAGAMACVVVPWFPDRYAAGADWRALAWWIHDHLLYASLTFHPKLAAFNIGWHQRPERRIYSYIAPNGWLTKPGMDNWEGSHAEWYEGFPSIVR